MGKVAIAVLVAALASPRSAAAADNATFLVLSRPLAHLNDLLQRPSVANLMAKPAWSEMVGGQKLDDIRAGLATMKPSWPEKVSVSLGSTAFSDLKVWGRIFILFGLCDAAVKGDTATQTERPEIQKALAQELRQARFPPLTVSLEMPSAEAARAIGSLAVGWLRSAVAGWRVPLMKRPGASGVRFKVGTLVAPAELPSRLVDMGLLTGEREPQAKALAAAVAALQAELWIEVKGTTVIVTAGPRSNVKATPLANPPITIAADQLVAFARWSSADVRAWFKDWLGLWQAWEQTESGRRAQEEDDSDLVGDLRRLAPVVDRIADRGRGWVWTDRGVHALVEEEGGLTSGTLAVDPVAAALPTEAVALDIDARINLGTRLSDSLSRIEERLSFRSLGEVLKGVDSGPRQQNETSYYQFASQLRRLVHDSGPTFFDGGSALVLAPEGRITRLDVREKGASPRTINNLMSPEIALVGHAKDPAAALRFVGEAWTALARASVAGYSADSPAKGTTGLPSAPPPAPGVEAHWLDLAWFERMANSTVTAQGGFKPQVAVADGLVVLSTSPRLARRIFEVRRGGAKDRLALPTADGDLVAWSRYPCAPIVAQTDHTFTTLEKLGGRPMKMFTSPRVLFGGVCNLIDGATLIASRKAGKLTSRYDLLAK